MKDQKKFVRSKRNGDAWEAKDGNTNGDYMDKKKGEERFINTMSSLSRSVRSWT